MAVIEKIKKGNLGEEVVQPYSNAKRLAQDALQTLREANLVRASPGDADAIALEGLHKLKPRYNSNNMPIEFLVLRSFQIEILHISYPPNYTISGT
jgi:hypothetical protein